MNNIVTTESKSIYEIDNANKKVRRLSGKGNVPLRLGTDGQWNPYDSIQGMIVGSNMIILWGKNVPLLPGNDAGVAATITSPVISIEEVN